MVVAAAAGLVLPHVYWLLVVKGIRPIALLPANVPLHLGIALLAAGVLPVGLLVFAAARCRLRFGGAASLGLIAAVVTAVLNYWVISWWYAEYFYNA